MWVKEKERKSIYIVLFWPRWYTQSAQAWITQFYLQIIPCLPFLRERSPDGTTTATEAADIQLQLTTHLSTRKDERLSWPSWLTCSGWFTHISDHPSATGRAQDSESTPDKDRCSTAEPRNQCELMYVSFLCAVYRMHSFLMNVPRQVCHDRTESSFSAADAPSLRIHRVKWRHISVVAMRSPFCKSTRRTVCS